MERKAMVQHALDATPHVGVIAALTGFLPPIAALFSIIWIAIQITEKLTGKSARELLACVCAHVRAKLKR